jgi:hypothetical protein
MSYNSDTDCDNDSDYEYEKKQNLIDNMFPNANFTIAIDIDELDEIITNEENIIVKSIYNCYCYDNYPRNTEYFYIKGKRITNKYILEELIRQNLILDCNHHFIEGFMKNPKSSCEFIIFTGS